MHISDHPALARPGAASIPCMRRTTPTSAGLQPPHAGIICRNVATDARKGALDLTAEVGLVAYVHQMHAERP
jgi:hypothetical protein